MVIVNKFNNLKELQVEIKLQQKFKRLGWGWRWGWGWGWGWGPHCYHAATSVISKNESKKCSN